MNLTDQTTRLMVSDAIEENVSASLAEQLRSPHWPLTEEQVETLQADLRRANGRRRTRTLSLASCINCAKAAIDDVEGYSYITGGHVANSYGYRSYTTVCVAAVRSNGTVRISVALSSGSKGSSPTTPVTGLSKNARPEAFREWADRG